MVKSCDFDVNSFLSEIDSSLEQSRDIFRQFDAIHRIITDEDWEMIQLKVQFVPGNGWVGCRLSAFLNMLVFPDLIL